MVSTFNCVQIKVLVFEQYFKPFKCLQIELLERDSNTWNYLIVCKQKIYGLFENCLFYGKSTILGYLMLNPSF